MLSLSVKMTFEQKYKGNKKVHVPRQRKIKGSGSESYQCAQGTAKRPACLGRTGEPSQRVLERSVGQGPKGS